MKIFVFSLFLFLIGCTPSPPQVSVIDKSNSTVDTIKVPIKEERYIAKPPIPEVDMDTIDTGYKGDPIEVLIRDREVQINSAYFSVERSCVPKIVVIKIKDNSIVYAKINDEEFLTSVTRSEPRKYKYMDGNTLVVKSGDNFIQIARDHNVELTSLKRYNKHIKDYDNLQINTHIYLTNAQCDCN